MNKNDFGIAIYQIYTFKSPEVTLVEDLITSYTIGLIRVGEDLGIGANKHEFNLL